MFVVGGMVLDRKQERRARDGQLLRGPSLISRWQFNRKPKGNGLRFRLSNRRNPFELLQPDDCGKDLVIRLDREAHHIQIAGDTGTGKSTLIRQIIYQIEARGEIAIVFDPDREYIQEFFNEERGDWVLNPKDERCPYWPIGDRGRRRSASHTDLYWLVPGRDDIAEVFSQSHARHLCLFARDIQADRERIGVLDGSSGAH